MKRETDCCEVTISPGGLKPAEAGRNRGTPPALWREHAQNALIIQPAGCGGPISRVSNYSKALKGQMAIRASGTGLWSAHGRLWRAEVQDPTVHQGDLVLIRQNGQGTELRGRALA